MTSEQNPETYVASYFYDSDTTCQSTSPADLVRRVDANNNTTCYEYDALHRLTAVKYPSGFNAPNSPERHFVYDSAPFSSGNTVYQKGGLAEAYTGASSAKITDLNFWYTARGELNNTFELTPHSGVNSYYQVRKLGKLGDVSLVYCV